jgi:hypothetical protein
LLPATLALFTLSPLSDFANILSEIGSILTSITFASEISTASPAVRASCLSPTDVCKFAISALFVLI